MTRVSLAEAYDNKDVITQIYRLMDRVDDSTYKSVNVTRSGNNIVFTFTLNNDDTKTFEVPDEGITDVSGTTSGSQVTITFTFTDGTTKDFTYTATGGVTVDTAQTITGKKTFTDIAIAGAVDGDVLVDGEVTADGAEIGGMAVEKSGSATVLSNDNGIKVSGHDLNYAVTANETQSITGTKTFTNPSTGLRVKGGITKSATPAADTRLGIFDIRDSDDQRYACFDAWAYANGNARIVLQNAAVRNGLTPLPQINIGVQSNGTPAITRSSVVTTEGSDSIITKGYAEATDGTTNNLVHKTANEKIAGTKTFTDVATNDAHIFRSKYYSVGSASGRSATPWKLLYKHTTDVASTGNALLTVIYSGSRSGAVGGSHPAILNILKSGTMVQAFGLGSSAGTAFRVVNDGGIAYVYGYAFNLQSGSGSTCVNAICGRNEDGWEKITDDTGYYAISGGTVTDSEGTVVVDGTAVTIDVE